MVQFLLHRTHSDTVFNVKSGSQSKIDKAVMLTVTLDW